MLWSGLVWLLLLALTRHVWIGLLAALPVAILWPVEMWLRIYHGTPINAHFIAVAWESTGAESRDFLSAYGAPLLLTSACWLLIYGAGIYQAFRTKTQWRHRSRHWTLAIFLPAVALNTWSAQAHDDAATSFQVGAFSDTGMPAWGLQWQNAFPISLGASFLYFQQQQTQLEQFRTAISQHSLHAQLTTTTPPDIVVLVIGESATATRWSGLGYERETTPLITHETGAVMFSNVVALSPGTRTAVPGVLSLRPALRPDGSIDQQAAPSLLRAFAEVGYYTHWLSNQSPLGQHDTSISMYAQEAQHVRFINPATYAQHASWDEALLQPLQTAISAPGRHFVVLHLLGSHFNFALRYPPAFNVFTPSSQDADNPSPEQIDNSYDNSVRYTDHILSRTIHLTRERSLRSVVAYFSDHGVDPATGACASHNAGRRSTAAYRVPVMVWMGTAQQQQTPELWQRLQQHQHQPYTTRAMYRSLLQLSGIETPELESVESFVERPLAGPRWVAGHAGNMLNFDQASQRSPCNLSAG